MKTAHDYQLKDSVRLVVLKQSSDGQPFWPIPDPLPPTIDACCEFFVKFSTKYFVFRLPGQYDIACGDLLVDALSTIGDSYWVYCSWCYLVEYVSADNTSCLVVAKQIGVRDSVKLPDRIYLTNDDFIKLHKPNPIGDLDAFVASLTTRKIFNSHLEFAIFKQSSDSYLFWPILSPLPSKACAYSVWGSARYHIFRIFEQNNILCNNLLIDRNLYYYLVKQVSVKENSCFVFAESVDVVKLPDRIYLENDFIQLHKPKPIHDLAEFVASVTIGDMFDNRWPFKINRTDANIYIFRDKDIIFYVGSSTNVYKRIRAHIGIKMKSNGHFGINTLVEDNLPDSRNWNIDLYRAKNAADLLRCEMQIIKRLCPVINEHGNPCPMPLLTRYKWRLQR